MAPPPGGGTITFAVLPLWFADGKRQISDLPFCRLPLPCIIASLFYVFLVPPEIIDAESSPSTVNIRENYNASLTCKASGIPEPEIIWKREDGRKIVLKRKKKEGKRGT